MKIASYYIGKPITGFCKRRAIWCDNGKGCHFPLVYFQKPKWLSEETYQTIVDSIMVNLPVDFEVMEDKE